MEPDSAAAEAGLKPGDVIQEINRKPVKNAEEAVRLTENPGDKTTLLRVWARGRQPFVVVDESQGERLIIALVTPHQTLRSATSHSGAGGLFSV